jgi:hypothetical protein
LIEADDCPSTGSAIVTTITSQSSSSLDLSVIHARMRAALAGLDEGTFTEGHELDRKTTKQVPKAMIGRRLSQDEAKRLLAKFD